MAYPDFKCSIEDNHGILVAVQLLQSPFPSHSASPAPPPSEAVKALVQSVTRFRHLSLENTPRDVHFRYHVRHSPVKPDRSDFQIHRQVFGLVCLAVADGTAPDPETEKRDLLNQCNAFLAHYGDKVVEYRCFVFKTLAKSSPVRGENGSTAVDGACLSKNPKGRLSPEGNGILNGGLSDSLRPVQKSFSANNMAGFPLNPGGKQNKTYIELPLDGKAQSAVESVMEEFLLLLFSGIEARRPTSAPDKVDKDWRGSNPSLDKLDTPKKDTFRLDLGSSQKKRQLGWKRKCFAEWLLLAGLPYHALQNFAQAVEMLQSAKETVHLAAALEGWAAASWYVLPSSDPTLALRVAALDRSDTRIVLTRTRAASLNGYLVNAFNFNLADLPKDRKLCLNAEGIYDKLKAAAHSYAVGEMGTYEMEVSLKLARLFTFLGEKIKAHKGLRQAIFVKLEAGVNESVERIERFMTVGDLYEQLGFQRQASLFRLLAADRYLGSSGNGIWQAFHLSVKSLSAYNLTFSTRPVTGFGWPELQAQVFQKLAITCRSQPEVYKRILLVILENFCDVLSVGEKDEILKNLMEVIEHFGPPVGDVPLGEAGMMLGVASLTKLPFVQEFVINPLPRHLQPMQRTKYERSMSGLPVDWIYRAPRASSRNSTVSSEDAGFLWVVDEPGTISLQLTNRLPKELRIQDLQILSENAGYQSTAASLILPSMSLRPFPVVIAGIPREPGVLSILGYSFSLFGMRTSCSISDLSQFHKNKPPKFVRVAPALPQIVVETSFPPYDSFVDVKEEPVVATASALLYNGQRSTCKIKVRNVGKVPVERLVVDLIPLERISDVVLERCVSFDEAEIAALLPLAPDASAEFSLHIWAALSFVGDSSTTAGTGSIPFFVKLEYSGGAGATEDYYRALAIAFFVDVIASVSISQWTTLAADEPEQFFLVLDFHNLTDEELEIIYPPNKKMLIVGRDQARIPALASKIPLVDIGQKDASQLCQKYLADNVALSWKFVEREGVRGDCWIGELDWSLEKVETMSLPPVSITYCLHGEEIVQPRSQGLQVAVGEVFVLELHLTNRFGSAIEGLAAGLEIREEQEMPNPEGGVGSVALLAGAGVWPVKLAGQERVVVAREMVMLVPGVFHCDVFFVYAQRRFKAGTYCLLQVGPQPN
ncbi:protein brunelleschi-like [Paramacrobiotus metropolitanus]|uniref:protein brunelleschi-like n=1 Tax=Paramacrobiotus metropolitanus TaxID=2943436 RepID=UPI002445FDB6|nr:protein brunelleschi-like [Paramacrobiotus metropolitanus]